MGGPRHPSVPGASRLRMPDVRERPPHHHLVVAAARAVGVELGRRHPEPDQVASGGAVLLDRWSGRRDVVGGDAVAQHEPGPAPPRSRRAGGGSAAIPVEVRGVPDVGGVRPSRLSTPRRRILHGLPALVAGEDVAVPVAEHVRRTTRSGDRLLDVLPRPGQMSRRIDRPPSPVVAEGVGREVDVRVPVPASA